MQAVLVIISLIAQTSPDQPVGSSEYLRGVYRADAEKYEFHRAGENGEALKLLNKPVMRWANDDDWSGDVFIWTHEGRPEVMGCMLSGPSRNARRLVYHEFHLLAREPIAPTDLLTKRRWAPQTGLMTHPIDGAPAPAASATARLTQMRQLAKEFTAQMQADGTWELRLLPQPLYRWGKQNEVAIDGALFGYVWTKGTDLELVLLLEARADAAGPEWHYAPVRFSNRKLSLTYAGQEVWSVDSHRESQGGVTDQLYTTAYAGTIADQPPAAAAEDK